MCSIMNRQRCCYNKESRLPRVFLSVVKSIFYLSAITTYLFGDMVHHRPRLYMLYMLDGCENLMVITAQGFEVQVHHFISRYWRCVVKNEI